eukprot:106908-Pelagomonas_calceolata.AAC.10
MQSRAERGQNWNGRHGMGPAGNKGALRLWATGGACKNGCYWCTHGLHAVETVRNGRKAGQKLDCCRAC